MFNFRDSGIRGNSLDWDWDNFEWVWEWGYRGIVVRERRRNYDYRNGIRNF